MVSLGPDGVQETLRKGLAMGAARAVQLKADEVPFDGLAIAQALAAELKDGGYDLILFGRMATDSANGTVGPMTAELLEPALRHRHLPAGDRRRARHRPARARRLGGDDGVSAARGAHDRRRHRAAAARLAQGDHGGQEEAAGGEAGSAGRGCAWSSNRWRCRPTVRRAESSVRVPTRCPSSCGCFKPKPRCCDGVRPGIRGITRRASCARWRSRR